jgi:2'-hydroxyisoflavone reductase
MKTSKNSSSTSSEDSLVHRPLAFAPSRRDILTAGLIAAAGGMSVLAASARGAIAHRPSAEPESPKPAAKGGGKSILILGGTGFVGPALLDAARARGHSVTLFNRGKTEKRKPGQFQDVEKLYGNRDPNLRADEADANSVKGLSALEGKKWDAVVDTSGYVPRIVKASAELLAGNVGHYVFISTISVYAENDKPNQDESAELGKLEDESVEDMGAMQQNYGPLKALCEKAAEAAMPGRVLNIRPGFIVGPNDPTDRFTYWPVRASKPDGYGEEMLAPGDGSEPVQFIDVRDLAEWIVLCIEKKTTGVYNATGPERTLTFDEVIRASVKASNQQCKPVWVPTKFLQEMMVGIGSELPIWIPPIESYAGFHSRNCTKAIELGLKFRTPLETCRAILDWWPKELERRISVTKQMQDDAAKSGKPAPQMGDPKVLRAGMKPTREAAVILAWNQKQADEAKGEKDKK